MSFFFVVYGFNASVSRAVCITFMDWVHDCLCFLVLPSAARTLIFFLVHLPSILWQMMSRFLCPPPFFSFAATSTTSSCHMMTMVLGRAVFPMIHRFRISGFGFPVEVHQLRFRSWLPSVWARFGFSLTKLGRFVCIGRSRDPAMPCAYF